jgi:hypothetical protein
MTTNYKRTLWNRGTGGDILLSNALNSAYGTSYIYTYSGTYTILARIENQYSSAHSGTCTASITVLGEDAVCGSGLNNQTLYDPDNNGDLINS